MKTSKGLMVVLCLLITAAGFYTGCSSNSGNNDNPSVTPPISSGNPAELPQDFIAGWSFENSLNVLADSSAIATFFPESSTALYEQGIKGQAISFDGKTQYVEIGSPSPSMQNVLNAFTLSAWIYPHSLPPSGTRGDVMAFSDGRTMMSLYAQRLNFSLKKVDSVNSTPENPKFIYGDLSFAVEVNRWTHVVLAWDGNKVNIYRDGQPMSDDLLRFDSTTGEVPAIVSDRIFTGPLYSADDAKIVFGAQGWSGPADNPNYDRKHYDGLLDEVVIYPRALTPTEVSDVFKYYKGN